MSSKHVSELASQLVHQLHDLAGDGSALVVSAEAKGFSTIRILKQFDKLPFDELAKLSTKSTLALGAAPAAAICALFGAFALLAVVRLGFTWSDMGRAMRAPESRDG
jgi:hypothetical protein